MKDNNSSSGSQTITNGYYSQLGVVELERLAIVLERKGQHDAAAKLWAKIEAALKAEVSEMLNVISNVEDEIVYVLQHSVESPDADTVIANLNKQRKSAVNVIRGHAEWLARHLERNAICDPIAKTVMGAAVEVKEYI